MINNSVVLTAKNLSKRYKIYLNPWHRFAEWFTFGRRQYHKKYWAVRDVSFELQRGEFLGVIGPNGAGKSTMLKIITDVTTPTSGEFYVEGRVLSILELSGGMDHSLTGRENVIRSGQLLGFPNGYIKERMEDIKEFSELEDFFEQPLRTYSTGMRTRLSFAMFAFLDCDVLILDEVLAVGDVFFKQKCFARLEELIQKNISIVLVTHNMGIVQRYCKRAILLNKGKVLYAGEASSAVNKFLQLRGKRAISELQKTFEEELEEINLNINPSTQKVFSGDQFPWPQETAFTLNSFPKIKGQGRARLQRLAILNEKGKPSLTFRQGDILHLYYEYKLLKDIAMPVARIEIRDKFNLLIHSKDSRQAKTNLPSSLSKGCLLRWHQVITLNLTPGNYVFSIELLSAFQSQPALEKSINKTKQDIRLSRLDQAFAIVLTHYNQENLELTHGGLVDLPGKMEMNSVNTGIRGHE